METIKLGTYGGFTIALEEVQAVKYPSIRRNINNDLALSISVFTINNKEYEYNWILKKEEYEEIPIKYFFNLLKSTRKVLKKYSKEEYENSENYKEAMECYNNIIQKFQGA